MGMERQLFHDYLFKWNKGLKTYLTPAFHILQWLLQGFVSSFDLNIATLGNIYAFIYLSCLTILFKFSLNNKQKNNTDLDAF